MFYNYNYSDYNSNPYFTPTSFNLDITNPALHNSNQPSMPDWSYSNHYMPQSSTMNKNGTIITTLHLISGDTTPPESYYQQPYQQTASYNPYQDQPIEEKSSLEKTFEAFLESTRQVQIIADSILPNNSQIQDPYSNFQVQPPQEELVDLENNMES